MAAYTATAKQIAKGHNDTNYNFSEHELAQALANTDTLSLTIPDGWDADTYVPIVAICWSAANPRLPITSTWSMTSYDQDTGVLVITATGAVANNATFVIMWVPATVGS